LPDVVVAEDTDVGVGEGLLGLLELGVHGTPASSGDAPDPSAVADVAEATGARPAAHGEAS